MTELNPVQQQIAGLLLAGHTLTVRWDCGGDESFVTTEVDGQQVEANYDNDTDFAFLLDRYLTDLLKLPDAGDFSMQGGGRIFREDREVVIEYESEFSDAGEADEPLTDDEWREMGLDPAEWRTEANPEPSPTTDASSQADYQPATADLEEADPYYSGRRVLFTLA